MRVLFVNHTGEVSGAERSLLELMGGLPEDVPRALACPEQGPLAAAARERGVPVMPIAGTDGSLRLHPTGTPRALGELSRAALQTARHARAFEADLLHANSVRAGLSAVAAGRRARRPVVVHVRDRLPRGRVADASLRTVTAGAALVIANSTYTAEGVRAVATPRRLATIANPIDLRRFDPDVIDREAAREGLGLPRWALTLGVVGQITPWKGQDEAVRVVALLAPRRPELRLLIVGEAKFVSAGTRYDNRAYVRQIERTIAEHELGGRVELLGERDDVPRIMRALDALLVPSWEEPFGRVVVEAMALGVPVLATSVGGPAELIRDGVDGLLLPPRDPPAWAEAVERICADESMRRALGQAGRERARGFGVEQHVEAVLQEHIHLLQGK
jgi:glycosyltransferase involved in cell wall biosynthesis